MTIYFVDSCHVETVCLLSNNKTKPEDYVEIGVDAEDYYIIKDNKLSYRRACMNFERIDL